MSTGPSLAAVMMSMASSREVVCALLVPARASVVGASGVAAVVVVAAALEELKRREGSCVRIELDCKARGRVGALGDNAPKGEAASRALRVVEEENCVVRVSSV